MTEPAAETEKTAEQNAPAEVTPATEPAQPVEGEAQQEPAEEEPVLVGYTVRYLDKATEEPVDEDTTGEGAVGDTITITAPTVEGYTLCADQPTELVLAADTENTATLYYEETMPAQTLSATAADGATVTIVAPEGALPEGTTVQIVKMDTVPALPGVEYTQAVAYDVTLWKDGVEVQPAVAVSVTLSNVPLAAESDSLEAYHFADDGTVDEGSVQGDKSADFSLSSFSPVALYDIAGDDGSDGDTGIQTFGYGGHCDEPKTTTVDVRVGAEKKITGDGYYNGKHDWAIVYGKEYVDLESWGDVATVTGKQEGTAKIKHTYGYLNRETEYFIIDVLPADSGDDQPQLRQAYVYAVAPDKDVSSTDKVNFFYVEHNGITFDVKGIQEVSGNVYSGNDFESRVYGLTDNVVKAKVLEQYRGQYPGLEADDISWEYHKARYSAGATGDNGKELVSSDQLVWHIDLDITINSEQWVSYTFKLQDTDTGEWNVVSNGVVKKTEEFAKPNNAAAAETTAPDGYVFDAWYIDSGFKQKATFPFDLQQSTTFYGRFIPEAQETYQVTYQNGVQPGSVNPVVTDMPESPVLVPAGQPYTVEPAPSRTGYTFLGWKDQNGNTYNINDEDANNNTILAVNEDITLTAQWELLPQNGTITVKVMKQDAVNSAPEAVTDDSTYITVAGLNGATVSTAADGSGDQVVSYQYTDINQASFTVTYSKEKTDGYAVQISGGYTAADNVWTCNNVAGGSTVVVTLYKELTLTYNGNGNDQGNVPQAQPVAVNDPSTTVAGAGTMTKNGYEFIGWSLKENPTTEEDVDYRENDPISLDKDTTLYAVWAPEAAAITVQYYMNGSPISAPAGYQTTVPNKKFDDLLTLALSGNADFVVPDAPTGTAFESLALDGDPLLIHGDDNTAAIANKTATIDTQKVTSTTMTIQVYYGTDQLDDEKDKTTGGDGIPDKYQAAVTYAVVNGYWNEGTQDASNKTEVVTLKNTAGQWDKDGTATITKPAVGENPAKGYKKSGSWNPDLTTVNKENDGSTLTFTYDLETNLTVTFDDATLTYNGKEQSGAETYIVTLPDGYTLEDVSGYIAPHGTTADTYENGDASDVTYKILHGTEDVTAQFTVAFVEGTLTITPIETVIEIIASSDSKNYDGTPLTNSDYTYTQGVLVNGDRLTAVTSGSRTDVGDGVNKVAHYQILSAKDVDVTNCYTVQTKEGKLSVYERKVKITANNAYKTEGQKDPDFKAVFGATIEGAVAGEELDFEIVRSNSDDTVGKYVDVLTVVPSTTSEVNKNYSIEVAPGTFTIYADQKGGQDGGKDGTPDDFQTIFQYVSGGNGTVSGTVYEVHTAADWQKNWQTATKPVVHPDASVDVTPAAGYVFSNFTGSDGKTYASLDAIRALETDQDMVFTANFTAAPTVANNLSYTVRYLEDNTARELASPKTVGGQTLGVSVTEYAPDIAGYSLMSDKNPQTITIGTGENIITFYYRAVGAATEPTPTPTENPTPVVLPATPTTPTTPAAPTTPAGPTVTAAPEEEVEAPAEEEEVPEEETPLAPEAGEEEAIGEEETPLASGNAAWALLNLILTILTVLGSLILLIGYLGKKRKEDEEGNEEYTVKKHGFWRVASLVPAIGAIIAFILTEDMSQPMVFVDRWTLLMVIIAVIQIVIAVLSMKDKQEPDEDDAANA